MTILNCFLALSYLVEVSFAILKNCSKPHDQPAICFKNETGYSKPLPTVLDVDVYFRNMINVDEQMNSISVQMSLWTNWSDSRLALSNGEVEGNHVEFNKWTAREVWHPEITFENVLNYQKTEPYGGETTFSFQLSFDKSYYMEYGEEFKITFSCDFHLAKYPFDFHHCPLYFGDERYNSSLLKFNTTRILYKMNETWQEVDPIIIDNSPLPFEFQLNALATKEQDNGFYNVSKTGICIKFKRKSFGLLLGGYYYPTTSFALLSMVSFVINHDVVPGRMGMIVTLYLISANVYNSVDAPKNRGFSYIEIWMFGTQFPILIALLEYGFVLLLKKVIKLSDENETKIFEEKVKVLDVATMIFSFCSFMIFASIYWIVALTSP